MLSISEGGLGLVTTAPVEQGEPIRLRFQAQGRLAETEIEALVWYDQPAQRSRGKRGLRFVGCVVPDRAQAFLDLFAEVEKRYGPPPRPLQTPARRARRKPRSEERDPPLRVERADPQPRTADGDLPHPRDPLPPPKPASEETQPRFRVRLRQIGGPRTRCVSIAACSMAQAAELAREEAESGLAASWAVLEVTLEQDEAGSRR